MHIGIAGNIGCGKTTLTEMLANHYGWTPKYEAVTHNPYLEDYYKDIETALAAYNAGMGNVSGWLKDEKYSSDGVTLKDIPFGETKRYVERVKKLQVIYEILY